MNVLPIFTSHYSLGGSILTLEKPSKPEDFDPRASESIIDLCVKNNIETVFLVDDNMSGIVTASKNAKEKGLKIRFGLKVTCCADLYDKTPESLTTEHKVIIFIKKPIGYEKVTDFYSKAATEGLYYKPRLDLNYIKENWDDTVSLVIPFYSSFLHKNLLCGHNCIPEFGKIVPTYFREDNELPFDYLLQDAVDKYVGKNSKHLVNTKSIYYNKNSDFKKYLTNRCIHKKSYLNSPNIDHMGSSKFSLESWLETR